MRLQGPEGRQARLLFIALWNLAEDHGVCRGNPTYLRGAAFPYDEDVRGADVDRWLGLLEAGGFLVRFERDGSHYLWIRGFNEHQKIDRPSKPTLPEPSPSEKASTRDDSTSTRRALDEHSLLERRGEEGMGKEHPPSPPRGDEPEQRQLLDDMPAHEPVPAPDALQALWNRVAVPAGRPRWMSLAGRERLVQRSLKACPRLDRWEAYLRWRLQDPFYRGERDWGGADVEWLLRTKTAREVCDFDPSAPARAPPRGRVMDTRPSDFSVLPEGEDLGTIEVDT